MDEARSRDSAAIRVGRWRHLIAVKYKGGMTPISKVKVEVGRSSRSGLDSDKSSDEVSFTMDEKDWMCWSKELSDGMRAVRVQIVVTTW